MELDMDIHVKEIDDGSEYSVTMTALPLQEVPLVIKWGTVANIKDPFVSKMKERMIKRFVNSYNFIHNYGIEKLRKEIDEGSEFDVIQKSELMKNPNYNSKEMAHFTKEDFNIIIS